MRTRHSNSNAASARKSKFIRRTITLPHELWEFVVKAKKRPAHAGSLSSYLRTLIVQDEATTK